MGHCVHAGGGGQLGRQADGDLRVQQRIGRDQGKVVDGIFVVGLAVGDNGGQRRLAAGAGGGGHRDQQRQRPHHVQQALHLCQRLVRPGDARAAGLGAVHAGPAAKGDDGPAAGIQIQPAGGLHVGHGGVGHRIVKDGHANVRFGQGVLQRAGQAVAADALVGDQQHLADVFPRQQLGHALHALQQFWLPVGQKRQRDAEHQLERAAVQFADRIHIHTSGAGCAAVDSIS